MNHYSMLLKETIGSELRLITNNRLTAELTQTSQQNTYTFAIKFYYDLNIRMQLMCKSFEKIHLTINQ